MMGGCATVYVGQSISESLYNSLPLKVHKNENFFGFDFEFCIISLLVMSKY
jgi:hypothetical protein